VAASLSAQFLLDIQLDMHWLFIITFACSCAAWVMLFFLPHGRFAAHSAAATGEKDGQITKRPLRPFLGSMVAVARQHVHLTWARLKLCYGQTDVLLWAFLCSMLNCCVLLSESYGSSFWTFVAERASEAGGSTMKDINGIMDAVGRGAGALGSLMAACIGPTHYGRHVSLGAARC